MDYIIVDAPPAEMFEDAQLLAEHADGILYVVRFDYLPKRRIVDGVETWKTAVQKYWDMCLMLSRVMATAMGMVTATVMAMVMGNTVMENMVMENMVTENQRTGRLRMRAAVRCEPMSVS